MRPTRFGLKAIVFYLSLVCAFYAAPYLNLFFMLLAFASVLAVLNVYWTWRNLSGVRGCMAEVAPFPAGCSPSAHLLVSSSSKPRHQLHAAISIEGQETRIIDHFDLEGGQSQRVEVQLPALARGIHPIDGLRIGTIYPLGTIVAWRKLKVPQDLVVYPEPADLALYRDRNGVAGLGAIGGGLSDEMGPAGLREFRDGDELRNVHWKATARRRELVVKELEADTCPGIEVRLDLRATDEELEQSLSLITALALECRSSKQLLTLHTQDHTGTYGKSHRAFADLFRYLAEVHCLPKGASAPPVVSPSVLCLPSPMASRTRRSDSASHSQSTPEVEA